MNIKEMRQKIIQRYEGIPEKQVSPGVYIQTVGNKYVTLLNTWNATTIEQITIEDFYANNFRG